MTETKTTAVRDVWVSSDRWPSSKDLAAWAADIFRLENARGEQEKAVALWKWLHICLARSSPAWREGDRGAEGYLMDTLKYLTVYGGHFCDGLARVMINAWQAAGGQARKAVLFRLGHTLAELRYRDADGQDRWHLFDPQHCWYVFARDGGHIASAAEIHDDPQLLLRPVNPPRPHFFSAVSQAKWTDRDFATGSLVFGDAPMPEHRMNIDLRRGESLRRCWRPGPQYWPMAFGAKPGVHAATWCDADVLGGVKDSFLHEYVSPYLCPSPKAAKQATARCRMPGFAELRYDIPLVKGGYVTGCRRAVGLASERKASAAVAALHPARAGEMGVVVYEVRTPYVIADAEIQGVVRTGSDPVDVMNIHISADGSSWWQVFGTPFAQKGKLSSRPKRIAARFGQDAYRAGQFSVVGKYGYFVRVEMIGRKDACSVGVDALALITRCQCNMMALPALLPGKNTVTVSASAGGGAASLQVSYKWKEKQGGTKSLVKRLPAGGGSFTVRVGGKSPRDVRMEEVSIAAI